MESMDRRERIVVIAALCVFLAIIAFGIYYKMWGGKPYAGPLEENQFTNELTPNELLNLQENKFTPEVPKNATETTPQAEAPAAPNVSAKLGFYDIDMSKDGFSPSSVAVKRGNLVKLRVTAVDGDYDFVIPYLEMSVSIKKGETRQVSFQADAEGTFLFECSTACPSNKKISGMLVMIP
jgi:heme/copper-type cytochrome/quinol oxidase subunit 2